MRKGREEKRSLTYWIYRKMQKKNIFLHKNLHVSFFCCTFATTKVNEKQRIKLMEAAVQQNYQTSQYHSLDEFADKLAKKLGQHYGMNDIRELLQ